MLCWLHPIVREGARLRGMIILKARPSWHPTLKEVFEPPLAREVSLPLGEWSFWSDAGIGRDPFLQVAAMLLKEKGQVPIQDSGWQRLDLSTASCHQISHCLLTVTEYHGALKMLTRVRCLVRMPRWFAALLIFIGLSLLLSAIEYIYRRDYVGAVAGFIIPTWFFLLRFSMKRTVFRAAQLSGMKPIS
jgi:hypothetical protein